VPALRYVVCDVFSETPLQGNQLAVFTDARSLDDAGMQALALEIGFSETAFVLPAEAGGHARVRFFTPGYELPFAGHPTLGTAFVLAAPLQLGVIELETGSGLVPVELERDESGRVVFGRMQQPVPSVEQVADPERLLAALGLEGSELPVELYDNGARHIFVALGSEDEVAGMRPDRPALEPYRVTGINCFAGSGDRWKTRMFSPEPGIGEDAATGSAAGPLACHLARHGRIEWGTEIEISQGAEIGRPSTLYARAEGGDGLIDRVEVGGSAVVVARGEFRL
jgi:trans-2,3-dihydro-3-hydroxyanthranilate isomerase